MAAPQRDKPARRILVSVLVAMSFLASALIVTLAVTSQIRTLTVYRMSISVGAYGSSNDKVLLSGYAHGLVIDLIGDTLIYRHHAPDPPPAQPPTIHFHSRPIRITSWSENHFVPNRYRLLGVAVNHERQSTPWTGPENIADRINRRTVIFLPWWLLLASAACPGLLWTCNRLRTRPARRQARGLCRRCAYNLSAMSAEVCPECGTACPAVEPKPGRD